MLTQGLADAVGNALIFVGALIAMAIIDPLLLGLIVLVIGVSVVGRAAVEPHPHRHREQQEKVGELASGVERAVGSIRTVRAAGATEREIAAVEADAHGRLGRRASWRRSRRSSSRSPASRCRSRSWSCSGVGGFRVATGRSRSPTS